MKELRVHATAWCAVCNDFENDRRLLRRCGVNICGNFAEPFPAIDESLLPVRGNML
jgi:hypothetical protein